MSKRFFLKASAALAAVALSKERLFMGTPGLIKR